MATKKELEQEIENLRKMLYLHGGGGGGKQQKKDRVWFFSEFVPSPTKDTENEAQVFMLEV
jgi:hypothetical protein